SQFKRELGNIDLLEWRINSTTGYIIDTPIPLRPFHVPESPKRSTRSINQMTPNFAMIRKQSSSPESITLSASRVGPMMPPAPPTPSVTNLPHLVSLPPLPSVTSQAAAQSQSQSQTLQQQQQQQQQLQPQPQLHRIISNRHALANGVPIAELDLAVTGSVDLSGDRKEKIDHNRVEDEAPLEEKYGLGKKLGQGSFGTVRLVKDKQTGQSYACKALRKKKGSVVTYEQQQREVAIMKIVRHPYIVQLYEVFETPKKFFLIMENCDGGELVSKIRKRGSCSEAECRLIMARIIDAVGYLHRHGIVHRDLKPENILLSNSIPADEFNIKVSDFGLATWVDKCSMMENVVGTPLYMAPEIWKNLPYSAQCDIWSTGVIMYLLICCFKPEAEKALHGMILTENIDYPARNWESVTPGARALCEAMLKVDPAKRLSAREVMHHPWMR
ncbi:Serine/threonine-protein kinase 33, partial [Blyttiomyces sp. JEL0837]